MHETQVPLFMFMVATNKNWSHGFKLVQNQTTANYFDQIVLTDDDEDDHVKRDKRVMKTVFAIQFCRFLL